MLIFLHAPRSLPIIKENFCRTNYHIFKYLLFYSFTYFNQLNPITVFPMHTGLETSSKNSQPISDQPYKKQHFSLTQQLKTSHS